MDAASLARQYADLPIRSTQKNVQDAIAAIIYSQTNATHAESLRKIKERYDKED